MRTEDSLTPGSQTARVALNQYAGTHYVEWIADETLADANRTAGGPPARTTADARAEQVLHLVPNPTDGPLQIDYRLPEGVMEAQLVVYDGWGQAVARYALAPEATTREVQVKLRGGLYQCVLRADGQVVARQRLMIGR